MTTKKTLLAASICAFSLALSGCAYDHKDYPRESWFVQPTTVIEAYQFKKVEEPLKVSLVVNYLLGRAPHCDRTFLKSVLPIGVSNTACGLQQSAILSKTGLFKIVKADAEDRQGEVVVDLSREMDPQDKTAIEAKKADPKIILKNRL